MNYLLDLIEDHQPITKSDIIKLSKYSRRYTDILFSRIKSKLLIWPNKTLLVKSSNLQLNVLWEDNQRFYDEFKPRKCPCGNKIGDATCNECTDNISVCMDCDIIFNNVNVDFKFILLRIPPTNGKNQDKYCPECDDITFHEFYDECLHCKSWGYTCTVCDYTNTYDID